MKKSLLVLNSVVGASLLTALVAAGTLLYLMFSTGEQEVVRRTGLFGSMFFETSRIADGGLGITMGVADPTALVVVLVVLVLLLAWIQVVYVGLRRYRARLIDAGAAPR